MNEATAWCSPRPTAKCCKPRRLFRRRAQNRLVMAVVAPFCRRFNETATSMRKLRRSDGDTQGRLHERYFVRHLQQCASQGSSWNDDHAAKLRRGTALRAAQDMASIMTPTIKKISCRKFLAAGFRRGCAFRQSF